MISLIYAIFGIMELCKYFIGIKRLKHSIENLKVLYESNSYIIVDKPPVSLYFHPNTYIYIIYMPVYLVFYYYIFIDY